MSQSTQHASTRQPYEMPTWAFSGGQWEQIDDPLDRYSSDGPQWFDELLSAAGYKKSNGFDDEGDWNGATIHEAEFQTELTARYRYLVTIDISYDWTNHIFVRDLPDLSQLLPTIAAWRSMARLEGFAEEMTRTAERAFRAWHGHDPHFACEQCDPAHMERVRFARRRRRSEEAKEAK